VRGVGKVLAEAAKEVGAAPATVVGVADTAVVLRGARVAGWVIGAGAATLL
jgi:hypothetical protein